ncbi:hypothetical protein E4U41_001784 [Claviceps citrina]|nr:hypothetical protein E4U41_001784 [Claviceps citrina]
MCSHEDECLEFVAGYAKVINTDRLSKATSLMVRRRGAMSLELWMLSGRQARLTVVHGTSHSSSTAARTHQPLLGGIRSQSSTPLFIDTTTPVLCWSELPTQETELRAESCTKNRADQQDALVRGQLLVAVRHDDDV